MYFRKQNKKKLLDYKVENTNTSAQPVAEHWLRTFHLMWFLRLSVGTPLRRLSQGWLSFPEIRSNSLGYCCSEDTCLTQTQVQYYIHKQILLQRVIRLSLSLINQISEDNIKYVKTNRQNLKYKEITKVRNQ